MLEKPHLVPWTTASEWEDVRKKIYSKKVEDVIEAYETMSMWQMRCANLPAYVDCTAGILQVMVQEYKNEKDSFSDYDLRLSYSTAVIRFINHVHGVSEHRNDTLYHSAKTQNIPDWLITMRHDAAHGQTLPALETFHLAAKISLQWLLENYWVQEEKIIYNMGSRHTIDDITMSNLDMNMLPIYKMAMKVWETCCDLMKSSLTLNSDLSQEQLSHINELIQMCENSDLLKKRGSDSVLWLKKILKFCKKPENVKKSRRNILKCLKFYITELLRSITNDDAARYAFVQSLLQSDFMLDTSQREWQSLLHLVQNLKCFQFFLECLFKLAKKENDMAVNLLETLEKSIRVQTSLWTWYRDHLKIAKSKEANKRKLKDILKQKLRKEKKKLKIQLKVQKPPKITSEMVENVLSYPSKRTFNLGVAYLNLTGDRFSSDFFCELEELVNLYFGEGESEFCKVPNEKIFTLDDLKNEIDKSNNDGSDDCEGLVWGRSEESFETWSYCPLGLLPHQKTVDCNLPDKVKWVTETESWQARKRASTAFLTSQAEGLKKLKISFQNIDS